MSKLGIAWAWIKGAFSFGSSGAESVIDYVLASLNDMLKGSGVATLSFNLANDAQIKLDGVKTADIITAPTSATGPLFVGMNTNNYNTVLGYGYTLAFPSIKVSRGADIIRDCVAVDDGTGRGALWDKVSQTLIDATPGGTVEIGPYI